MKHLLKSLVAGFVVALMPLATYAQESIVTLRSMDQNFEATGELVSFDDAFYVLKTAVGEMNIPRDQVECFGDDCPVESAKITLRSGDGTFFEGDLLGYDGTNYVLNTTIGVLTIRGEFVQCEGVACPEGTQAQEVDTMVVLRSGDGTFFEGDLQGFDGTSFILKTSVGVLTIRGEFVTCEGQACPDTGPVVSRFTIAAPAGEGQAFIAEVLERFTDEKSLNLTRSIGGEGKTQYLIGASDGTLIADITVVPSADREAFGSLFANDATFIVTRQSFAQSANSGQPDPAQLTSRPIALDALVTLVHPTNRVNSVSVEQMGDILSGRIINWAQLGGLDEDIVLLALNDSRTLSHASETALLSARNLSFTTNLTLLDTPEALAAAVNSDPRAIAVSYRSSAYGAKILSTRNTCNMFSSPNPFSLQTGEYPLTMTWNLYAIDGQEIPEVAVALSDYLISDQGQAAAKAVGLVGLDIDQQPMSAQGERLLSAMVAERISSQGINAYRNYLSEVSSATRLSTTLRFITGGTTLDERSRTDIQRISNLISKGILDQDNLVLIGFSDSVGSFTANVNLSRSRAGVVKALLLQDNVGILQNEDVLAFGFGPVAPVGCNTVNEGRSLNRRVEVWIRGVNEQGLN